MLTLIPLLFIGFLIGTLFEIAFMLSRKHSGQGMERFRLVFFFVACLMLVCLVPLWLSELLTREVWLTNLGAFGANMCGWLLTFRSKKREGRTKEEPGVAGRIGVRTYTIYYQGKPFGLITKGAFDKLIELELLKKQRNVELVDDYREQARRKGVRVQQFKSKDGSQILVKVEIPE